MDNLDSYFPLTIPTGIAGTVAGEVIRGLYPLSRMTQLHNNLHIKGLTGTWMDIGASALTGRVAGPYHRMFHGHHLFSDGFTVLVNPKLTFGQFLHHLGCDFLTKTGVPVIPKSLATHLRDTGVSQSIISEFGSVNLPKVLGGSLSLICSGVDVYMAFSDAIPHTYSAAFGHAVIGAFELAIGCLNPNPLLIVAGAAELGVAAATAYRAFTDPIVPSIGVPESVFFPMLGEAIGTASVLGACSAILLGGSWTEVSATTFAATAAASATTTVNLLANTAGFLAPIAGPAAGIATYLLARKLLTDSLSPSDFSDRCFELDTSLSYFDSPINIPLHSLPESPIGVLKGDRLILNEESIEGFLDTLF